ncbi:tripartite tricarboxylate transporter permease [Humitalea sp. 24SJ18S-53]|uniref:tripartite tricarboxylate transporter permease n=1 Tax=Humitalea sp. 24SJ18S-53 TaxID=3422307 RepID=UPI003D673503
MEFYGDALMQGLSQAFTWDALLFMAFGSIVGYVFGVLPGLQSVTALSVFLPLTYFWSPMQAMYFFAGIIGAGGNGGAVTSIIVNIPGNAQNAATMIEGYPITRQGRAVFALNLSASASWFGAAFGVVVLVALIPVFMPFLLSFGPAETFWIAVAGLVTLVLAMTGNVAKGLISVGAGVVLAVVGMGGPRLPVPRFTFGSTYLLDGLEIVVIVMGLLVLGECIEQLAQEWPQRFGRRTGPPPPPVPKDWKRQAIDGWIAPFRHWSILLRSSGLGTVIGAIPGVGGVVAQFMAYNLAAATTKNPEKLGKGAEDVMVATEAATNSKEGGNLFPTLLFGIPGNSEMALVLAAWQIHGIEPGPMFLQNHAPLAWALVFGLVLSNLVASVGTAAASPWLARLPSFDMTMLAPPVLAMSLMSTYTVRSSPLDLGTLVLLGAYAYLLRRFGFSVIGMVVGFVLGDVIERNYFTALQSALGDHSVLLGSNVALTLAGGTLVALLWSLFKLFRAPRLARAASARTFNFANGSLWFNLFNLALFAWLLSYCLAPTWRGGPVVTGALALMVGLQALALWGDLRRPPDEDRPGESRAVMAVLAMLVGVLAVSFFAGLYVGTTLYLVGYWLLVYRAPWPRTLVLAACFGLLMPLGFAWLTDTPMWRGVLPEIIPGILGGEVMPDL